MKDFPEVSIIIVSFNGRELLDRCLASVFSLNYPKEKIFPVLVDNNSGDSTVEFVSAKYPRVEITVNKGNGGFAAANNIALKKVQAEYVLLLNNDAVMEKDSLSEMVTAAQKGEKTGMVAPKILYLPDKTRIQSAGLLLRKSGRVFENKDTNNPEENKIFCPTGAAALYKKKMLDEIGYFDEDFFAYYEDVDLAWRARHNGWTAQYAPSAVIYHELSASWGRRSKQQRYYCLRNRIFTIIKNWPFKLILLWLPYAIFFNLSQAFIFSLRYGDLVSFSALFDAAKGFGKQLKKRKFIKSSSYFKNYFVPIMEEIKRG